MNQSALAGFVKIVELNSFSAAAEALYLSQSALSQQIRTLEGQLQFELFQHVPRRVMLTPAGQDFYPKAKQLVTLYQQAVRHARAVQQQANPPERYLVIAGCHEAMRMFVYDVFSLTSELCLQYTPILGQCANRSEIWRSLKKGEMDLSFQLESAEFYAQGLTFVPLFYVPELCIPIHPPADMPTSRLTLEQALQYRWLPACSGPSNAGPLAGACRCPAAWSLPGPTWRKSSRSRPRFRWLWKACWRRPGWRAGRSRGFASAVRSGNTCRKPHWSGWAFCRRACRRALWRRATPPCAGRRFC